MNRLLLSAAALFLLSGPAASHGTNAPHAHFEMTLAVAALISVVAIGIRMFKRSR